MDIVAFAYLIVSLLVVGAYTAIRYGVAKIAEFDVVMWTWTLTALLGMPALHVLLAVLALTGRRVRVPLLWRIAATLAAPPVAPAPTPSPAPTPADPIPATTPAEAPAQAPAAPVPAREGWARPEDPFDQVWQRVLEHAGERFQLIRGGPFHYRTQGEQVYPDRTTIGLHRSNFARAWSQLPLSGPGQISRDVMGPSYVWAILNDPRVAGPSVPEPRREPTTRLLREMPYTPGVHRGGLASRDGCSWHGRTCHEPIVASVLTQDRGGETWHAVCDRALATLRGD